MQMHGSHPTLALFELGTDSPLIGSRIAISKQTKNVETQPSEWDKSKQEKPTSDPKIVESPDHERRSGNDNRCKTKAEREPGPTCHFLTVVKCGHGTCKHYE